MAEREAPTGEGGLAVARFFVDGGDIKWDRLATTLVGSALTAYFTGLVEFILSLGTFATSLISGVSGFAVEFIQKAFGNPQTLFETSWQNLQTFVSSAGPASFALTVAAVLGVFYIVRTGVARFG